MKGRKVVVAVALANLLVSSSVAYADGAGAPFVTHPARFQGPLVVSAGTPSVDVVSREWLIPNHEKIGRLPEEGMLVVELRGGVEMTTIIDGKRAPHREGDIWVVPAGSSMGIETGRYAVWLHVVAVRALNQTKGPS